MLAPNACYNSHGLLSAYLSDRIYDFIDKINFIFRSIELFYYSIVSKERYTFYVGYISVSTFKKYYIVNVILIVNKTS